MEVASCDASNRRVSWLLTGRGYGFLQDWESIRGAMAAYGAGSFVVAQLWRNSTQTTLQDSALGNPVPDGMETGSTRDPERGQGDGSNQTARAQIAAQVLGL